jgi:hypothetical protein
MTISGISWVNGWGRLMALALAGIFALGLTGCAAVYRNHGYVPSEEELALIEVGKDSRELRGVAAERDRPSGGVCDLH